jgi:diguanylate cyclase (GGDEF)-like protein
MPDPQRKGFVVRLWLVVISGAVLMLVLVAHSLLTSKEQHEHQAAVDSRVAAAVIEREIEDVVQKANLALFAIKIEAERQLNSGDVQPGRLASFAAQIVEEVPDLHSLGVADAEGRIVAGSNMPPPGTSVADRVYFQRLRDKAGNAVAISEVLRGRTAGTPILVIARRIEKADGTFAGIAINSVQVARLRKSLARAEVGINGVAALRGEGLRFIARWPVIDEGREKIVPVALQEFIRKGAREGIYHHVSSIDGAERIVAYRQVGDFPLYLAVGRSRDQYLALFARDATTTILLAGLLVALTVTAAAALQRSWSRQRKATLLLERQVDTDELTGAASRRHFFALAQAELDRRNRYGGSLSLLMLDIDHFKEVNDTCGHKSGDRVLRRLVEICAQIVRRVDFVGRVGGEEFAILLPETGTEQAAMVAERLRKAVAAGEVHRDAGKPIRITASLGVATVESAQENIDTLMSRADDALYQAKNGGRDRVCVAAVRHAGMATTGTADS